jgi:hypothetical protein
MIIVYQSIHKYMVVYTGCTVICLYILVYAKNIVYIHAYTVTWDRYIFNAEAHFYDASASSDTYPMQDCDWNVAVYRNWIARAFNFLQNMASHWASVSQGQTLARPRRTKEAKPRRRRRRKAAPTTFVTVIGSRHRRRRPRPRRQRCRRPRPRRRCRRRRRGSFVESKREWLWHNLPGGTEIN